MIYLHEIELFSGDTWDVDLYPCAYVTASGGNVALTATIEGPGVGALLFTQDGTGGRTLTINGAVIDVDPTAGSDSVIDLYKIGGKIKFKGYGTNQTGTTTVAPPEVTADDGLNTLSASHTSGMTAIYVSENGGTYAQYTGPISVGNVARAAGYWRFKAIVGGVESAVVDSPEFTVSNTLSGYTAITFPTVSGTVSNAGGVITGGGKGLSTAKIPKGSNGKAVVQAQTDGKLYTFGLELNGINDGINGMLCAHQDDARNLYAFTFGSNSFTAGAIPPAGTYIAIDKRGANNSTAQYWLQTSADGVTWNDLYQFSYTTDTDAWPGYDGLSSASAKCYYPQATGLAA